MVCDGTAMSGVLQRDSAAGPRADDGEQLTTEHLSFELKRNGLADFVGF